MKSQPTILVVEDHPLNMKLVRSLLTLAGYAVIEAENGHQALQLSLDYNPDLILMDLLLPDMDGLEATRLIKERKETQDIPVVALTAYAMAGDEQRAKEAGCSGYISKPIDTRTFVQTIARYMKREGPPEALIPGRPTSPLSLPSPGRQCPSLGKGTFDLLTGLPDKHQSRKFLEQELKRASRQQYSLTVLLLAIDEPRLLHQSRGYGERNRLLQRLAEILKGTVREIDFVARYGEETFAFILPYAEEKEALKVAKRLQQALSDHLPFPEADSYSSFPFSMGIAVGLPKERKVDDLFYQAEAALIQAQKEGKNRIKIYKDS